MLVFWKEKLVYLATPKTGSTAIEAALEPLASVVIQRPPALKHTNVRRYWQSFAPFLERASGERFEVVAMMREPVGWLSSWYRYRQRDNIYRAENSTKGISFDQFVEAYLGQDRPPYANLGRQSAFLHPDEGRGADRIFRYEAIGEFVHFLEDRLNCEISLPRLNVSPEGPAGLSAGVDARLRRELAEDFALYASLG